MPEENTFSVLSNMWQCIEICCKKFDKTHNVTMVKFGAYVNYILQIINSQKENNFVSE
jgi:hypothetical protein